VQHAILHGDEITGASTFQIETGLDTGPVFGVITEPIRPTDTAGSLLGRLAQSGAGLLAATMDGIADGSLVARPQATDGVSVAAKIMVDDARVAWTVLAGERLKLGPVRVCAEQTAEPGTLCITKNSVLVGTATSAVELGDVQAPGKRPMPAADWARGARPAPGTRLG
jgi:methionyl-tRNA formyltransferase